MLLVFSLLMSGCAAIQNQKTEPTLDSFDEVCKTVSDPRDTYNGVKDTWSAINKRYIGSEKRKLVVFMDGTSNTKSDNTNIWKLYKLSLKHACTGSNPVIPYYDKGVGAKWFDFINGGFAGSGASLNIRQAYRFLVQTYKDGDEIFIFGFSRGAFTARSLNGMLYYVGLLKKDKLESNWQRFRTFTFILSINIVTFF